MADPVYTPTEPRVPEGHTPWHCERCRTILCTISPKGVGHLPGYHVVLSVDVVWVECPHCKRFNMYKLKAA